MTYEAHGALIVRETARLNQEIVCRDNHVNVALGSIWRLERLLQELRVDLKHEIRSKHQHTASPNECGEDADPACDNCEGTGTSNNKPCGCTGFLELK